MLPIIATSITYLIHFHSHTCSDWVRRRRRRRRFIKSNQIESNWITIQQPQMMPSLDWLVDWMLMWFWLNEYLIVIACNVSIRCKYNDDDVVFCILFVALWLLCGCFLVVCLFVCLLLSWVGRLAVVCWVSVSDWCFWGTRARTASYTLMVPFLGKNDHTIMTAPLPVCSAKLSMIWLG